MAPLAQSEVLGVLDDYEMALRQLESIADVLRRLGPSWQASRNALNELTRALNAER
jgi:hypothetical protein